MRSGSTFTTSPTTIVAGPSYAPPSFWDHARRITFAAGWMYFHLKAGELAPEIVQYSPLYGRAAVQSLSASTWAWNMRAGGGIPSTLSPTT